MQSIRDQIKNGQIGSLYLLCGEETYLVRVNAQRLRKALLTADDEVMNLDEYEESLDLSAFSDSLQTLPFMAERRVIMVSDSGAFGKKAKELEGLGSLLSSVPDTVVVIFCESDVDKRSKNYTAMKKYGQVFDYARLSEPALRTWILQMMHSYGVSCDSGLASYLLSLTGPDMANLESEVGKLCAYTAEKKACTREDIDAVITPSVETTIFRLTDQLSAGNSAGAYAIFRQLVSQGEVPQRIFAMIVRQFRILYRVSLLETLNKSEAQRRAMNELKVPSFKVSDTFSQASRFGTEQLLRILGKLLQTDEAVKTGQMTIEEALDLTILTYTHPERPTRVENLR